MEHVLLTLDRLPEELHARLGVISDLQQVSSLLAWDQHTYMPPAAAAARGQQLATLGTLIHDRLTDPELGRALERLERDLAAATGDAGSESPADDAPDDGADGALGEVAALARQLRRAVEQATKLPRSFIEAYTRQKAIAQQAWVRARQESNFALFAPELTKIIDFARQQADYLGYHDHPYDALHDLYEPGSTRAAVQEVFTPLRDATVALLRELRDADAEPDDGVLRQEYDEALQEQFGLEVVRSFGFDLTRGRLDRTVHPFAQGINRNDVRITTRYARDYFATALFGTMHETGHGLYEQGIAERYQRTPLAEAASLGVHESQSRLYENLVGRSYPFWQHFYPKLQQLFPQQLGAVDLEHFYAAINRVRPSFIRVEADEVTYNLHIMVRFELEQELLDGRLAVEELPAAWNARYQEYLGITPPDDARGCLQDVHWSFGLIGYFPTYTLGNLMSVQLFEAAKAANPGLLDDLRAGRFGRLLDWLQENVHRHGSRYLPAELLERATGSKLDAAPYLEYLNAKFRALYGLTSSPASSPAS